MVRQSVNPTIICFEQNQIDSRFAHERMQFTETACDNCGGVILESENRFEFRQSVNPAIICEECYPKGFNRTVLEDAIVRFVRGLRGPRLHPVTYKQIAAHVRRLPAFEQVTEEQLRDAETHCVTDRRIRAVAMTLSSHRRWNGRYGYKVR